jgi:hypothetical protein
MDAAKMGDSHHGCEGSPAFFTFLIYIILRTPLEVVSFFWQAGAVIMKIVLAWGLSGKVSATA